MQTLRLVIAKLIFEFDFVGGDNAGFDWERDAESSVVLSVFKVLVRIGGRGE